MPTRPSAPHTTVRALLTRRAGRRFVYDARQTQTPVVIMLASSSNAAPQLAANASARLGVGVAFTCLDTRFRAPAPPARGARSLRVTCAVPRVDSEKRVTLVRHGQSTWNEEGRIQGSSDLSVLTAKGEAQAETTRQMLLGKHFDVGFRSPLKRASRTAEVIWDVRTSELVDLWELREIDLYSFQGLLKGEGKERFGEAYATWKSDPVNFEIDGHFPVRELWNRGDACWDSVLRADGKDVLVVAHNAVIQSMIGNALDLSPQYFRRLIQSNCGLTTFEFSPRGVLLETLNQTPATPLKGNADGSQSRAVFICSTGAEGDKLGSEVATALREENIASMHFDDASSSSDLAAEVAKMLNRATPTLLSGSMDDVMDALRREGTTVMFAESRTVENLVACALDIDEGLTSRVRLSAGGITVVDFIGSVDNYQWDEAFTSIACVNYTAHLGE